MVYDNAEIKPETQNDLKEKAMKAFQNPQKGHRTSISYYDKMAIQRTNDDQNANFSIKMNRETQMEFFGKERFVVKKPEKEISMVQPSDTLKAVKEKMTQLREKEKMNKIHTRVKDREKLVLPPTFEDDSFTNGESVRREGNRPSTQMERTPMIKRNTPAEQKNPYNAAYNPKVLQQGNSLLVPTKPSIDSYADLKMSKVKTTTFNSSSHSNHHEPDIAVMTNKDKTVLKRDSFTSQGTVYNRQPSKIESFKTETEISLSDMDDPLEIPIEWLSSQKNQELAVDDEIKDNINEGAVRRNSFFIKSERQRRQSIKKYTMAWLEKNELKLANSRTKSQFGKCSEFRDFIKETDSFLQTHFKKDIKLQRKKIKKQLKKKHRQEQKERVRSHKEVVVDKETGLFVVQET